MLAGVVYKFKVRTINDQGPSEFSEELDAAVSSFPAKPNPPTRIMSESDTTSLTLQWTASADTELPVIGYVINMDDGFGANYRVVYNGKNFPNVLKYTIGGLTTGYTYSFSIQAINFNGLSEESDPQLARFIVCVPPQRLRIPQLSKVTKTAMTLRWIAPLNDGGCPITSYSIWIDDGNNGAVYTEVDPSNVKNIPALR